MGKVKYVTVEEFSDFNKNMGKLITVLNHNMTKITTDVCWLKKIAGWHVALLTAIAAALIGTLIKLVMS